MRQNRYFCSFVMIAFFWQSSALAQTCSHVDGYWTMVSPPEGTFSVNQSGQNLSGNAYPYYCISAWDLDGTYIARVFSGTVTNPLDPDELYFCYPEVEYTGVVEGPGCDTAIGEYSNIAVSNQPFTWQKACDTATGETTSLGSWDDTFHTFQMTVHGSDGPNFGGRGIFEDDYAPADDGCYYQGSMIPEAQGVTGTSGYLNASNGYLDTIGWFPDAVNYYRQHEVTPCAATLYQRMFIWCNVGGPVAFKDNVLILQINSITVSVRRDGVFTGNHGWP